MKNKKILIGLSILAVAGIAYYFFNKKKAGESVYESEKLEDSSFTGIRKTKSCCVKEVNGKCLETKEVHYLTPCPNAKKGEARTVPMPSTGICPKGYMKGANNTYCKPIPASMIRNY